jgi:O-antigen ligase
MNAPAIAGISHKLSAGLVYTLFFLIVAFPAATALYPVKAVLLGVILIAIVAGALINGRFALDPTVALLTVFFAAFGFLLVVRGFLTAAPGAANLSGVHAVWPFVYLILVGGTVKFKILRNMERTIAFAAILVGLLAIVYLLSQVGILPAIPHFDSLLAEDEMGIGFFSGYVRMALPGINALPFVAPFLMAALVVGAAHPAQKLIPKLWLWAALLLSTFVVIVSGRRALELVTMMAPLLVFVAIFLHAPSERLILFKSLRRFVITLILGISLVVLLLRPVYAISFSGFFDRFSSGFDFSPTSMDNSPDERRQQFFALERGWLEHPLLGAGLGEPAYGSIRSEDMPWAYELSYLALLFQTGLVGLATYASGIGWIYWMGAKIIRRGGAWAQLMLPLLVGMTSFLIANATNPYLAKFDGLWTIFLPIALINLWLVERRQAAVELFPAAAARAI